MNKRCMYCDDYLGQSEHYVVKEAIKPKGSPRRWKTIGHACETCIDYKNKPCMIDKFRGETK